MKWSEFLQEKQAYCEAFEKLKADFDGDMRKFLDKSYLVVTYNRCGQISLDSCDMETIAKQHSDFLKQDSHSARLIWIANRFRNAKRMHEQTRLSEEQKQYFAKVISVVEHQIEMRFPTMNIDFIQQVKQTKYCNQQLTDMTKVSIRVIMKLKPGGCYGKT